VFKYISEEHSFITGNLHCKLTQRRPYTRVGKKMQLQLLKYLAILL